MGVLKRTYALPAETVLAFERAVKPGRRSAAVAAVMREWLEEKERQLVREAIVEGLAEMADEYLVVEREYHPLEEEVERGPRRRNEAWGGGTGTTRPGRRV